MKTVLAVIALCVSAVGQTAYLGAGSFIGAGAYGQSACGPPAYSCLSTSTAAVPMANPIPSWGVNTCDNTSPYTLQTCGNLTGAGTVRTPSDFGNAIARLTDASTTNAAVVWGIVDNGESNLFASDDSWIIIRINAGTRYIFTFNPATMAGGLSGITYSNIQLIADHNSNSTIYGLFGTNATQIYRDTLPVPLAACAPSCTQPSGANHVLLYDFLNSNCLLNAYNGNPSFTTSNWDGMFASSLDDSTFAVGYADNTTSGKGKWVAVWKKSYGPSGGCDLWNTSTGAILAHDGTQLTDSNSDTFYVHEAWPALNNTYAIVSTGSSQMINGTYVAGYYIWQIGTANVVHCGAGAAYCDGHEASGYLNLVAGGKDGIHLYTNPNASAPPTTLIAVNNCDDNHESWNHDNTLDSFPVENSFQEVGSIYNLLGGATPPCTYYDEIDMAQTTPGTVSRAAHTFNSGWHWGFEQQNAIGVESSTGNFVMWPSDGWGQFGSTSGTGSCNIGGPDWTASDSADFHTGTGFGSCIMPQSSNSGHYIFQAQSCSGACATGSTEPAWGTVQTPAATITDNTITWVNTGNAYNCRSDILIVKLTR